MKRQKKDVGKQEPKMNFRMSKILEKYNFVPHFLEIFTSANITENGCKLGIFRLFFLIVKKS